MRKKYYHAATPETMEKIIADGVVKRGWDGCVYLCEKPQDAAKFVAIRGHDEVAVIEVILPANKVKESFDHSVQFFQCKAFMYEEDIKVRPNAEVVEYSFGTVCGDGGDQRIRNGEKFPGCYRSGGLSGQKRMGASAQSAAGNRNSNKGHHQRVHKGAERVPV